MLRTPALEGFARALQGEDSIDHLRAIAMAAATEEGGQDQVLVLVERAARDASPGRRSPYLLLAATLALQSSDFERRARHLIAAFQDADGSGDQAGQARSLAELAAPWGGGLAVGERIAFGERAVAIAREVGQPMLLAQAMGKLAIARVYAGEPDFALSREAAAVAGAELSAGGLMLSHVNHVNWAMGALAYGDYSEAAIAIARGRARAIEDLHVRLNAALACILAWRRGTWDQIAERSAVAGHAGEPVFAQGIAAMVAFEREPGPGRDPMGPDDDWVRRYPQHVGPLLLSLAVTRRLARREPVPERGVIAVIERVSASDIATGWDDLLPVASGVSASLGRRISAILGTHAPLGPRAKGALLLRDGIARARSGDGAAADMCVAAGEAYEATGDAYLTARALSAAAAARIASGRRAGGLHVRAADLYARLGAHRSLATLLRAHPSSSALARFAVPQGWSRARAQGLTKRERDVADLGRQGFTALAIAERLGISHRTVQVHLDAVRFKLGIERKVDLVRAYATDRPPVLDPTDAAPW